MTQPLLPETVEHWPIERLRPYDRNARTHSDAQIDQIAASMVEFGWTNPVLVSADGTVIAGHGRIEAAKKLGAAEVPVLVLHHLTDAQRRAYVLADNKLALNAGWNEAMLASELRALGDEGFDLPLIGFSDEELADILEEPRQDDPDIDAVPDPPQNPVTELGDVWILGRHRLMCADSTSIDAITRLTAGVVPDLANCDPPYGISVVKGGNIGGAKPFGRVHGRARKAIIEPGTYSPIIGDETTDTAVAAHEVLVASGVPAVVLWGGNYFADKLPPSRCWLVWDKENTGSFADAELAWTNQDKVVKLLRHQWSGLIKASERGERRVHPTQKPVALAEWVIETIAPQAETVIDLFLGGGWTLIACERMKKTCFGMELAPAYCDVSLTRWQTITGQAVTLEETGETFAEVLARRQPNAQLKVKAA